MTQLDIAVLLSSFDQNLPPEAINAVLDKISRVIYPNAGLRLIWLSVDDVREQDINAQSMPKAMFDQLVDNIKNTGAPESLPLLVRVEQGIEIISGHHRTRAIRAAGQKMFLALMYESLDRARIHAKQLAHNSINGTSDPEIIKRIWERITDVQARFEAFIDPRVFDSLKPVSFKPVDVDMQATAKTILIVFLPTQMQDFDAALEAILPKGDVDKVYLANRDVYEGWRTALNRTRSDLEIVNAPTALAEMARLATERLEQLKAEQE